MGNVDVGLGLLEKLSVGELLMKSVVPLVLFDES